MIQVQLMDVCDFQGGSQPPKEEWLDSPVDGYIRMLQIRDFTQQESTKPEYVKASSRLKYCDADDILVARYGASIGKILRGLAGAYNVAIMKTVPIAEKVDKDYLYYFLISSSFQNFITQVGSRAAQAGFNKEDLKEVMLPLPPIEIQRKIAAVLDKAQELIDLRKAQLEKMDEFLRSVFLDMFGDPVTNPKGWEKKKLGVVGSLKRGMSKHRPRNAPELLGGPYPLIQTGDVSNAGIYIRSFTQTYSELGLQQSKMWPCGTLCITIAANIAKTGILKFDACFPDSVVGFVPLSSEVNKEFVHYWFSFFQQFIEAAAPESAQKNINLKILEEQNIVVPPLHLQTRFAAIVEATEAQKALMQQSLTEMENNFNSLMQQAFRGELF